MHVEMALRRIVISEIHDQQFIELRELDGGRKFTIVIGLFEATSIDRRVKKMPTQRPLTHDLLVNTIREMGGDIKDIVVSELREHTYYAVLRVSLDGNTIEIDARPSDAIAVAVTADVPIYVAEEVLREVANESSRLGTSRRGPFEALPEFFLSDPTFEAGRVTESAC